MIKLAITLLRIFEYPGIALIIAAVGAASMCVQALALDHLVKTEADTGGAALRMFGTFLFTVMCVGGWVEHTFARWVRLWNDS